VEYSAKRQFNCNQDNLTRLDCAALLQLNSRRVRILNLECSGAFFVSAQGINTLPPPQVFTFLSSFNRTTFFLYKTKAP
jgi:hypothetical protein